MKSESTDQFTTNVTKDDNASNTEDDITATENFSVGGTYEQPNKKFTLNEKVAAFCSSWKFIVLMSVILVIWIILSLMWWSR